MGMLIPVLAVPVVPGDKFHLSNQALVRFMPLIAPVMHRFNVTFHSWFVPNRLVWDNWEDFIVDKKTGGLSPVMPTLRVDSDGTNYSRLLNFMGIPDPTLNPGAVKDETINAMPFAAYQLIYNEFYRDENLVPEVDWSLVDGDNSANLDLYKLRLRAWMHDYFTSALPFAQKGDPVLIPGNIADAHVKISRYPNVPPDPEVFTDTSNWNSSISTAYPNVQAGIPAPVGDFRDGELFSDNSGTTSTNVSDLRIAVRLQEFLEKLARGGSRYIEMIKGIFGVISKDSRLQRPEYIGGSSSPVVISEVLNTTGTTTAAQGTMAGHGVSVTNGKSGSYFASEYGQIITIMNIQPTTQYQQGIPRYFSEVDSFTQQYFPDFANLGEQHIANRELFAYVANAGDPFGYTPRYSHYKYMSNRVCGQMADTLAFWTEGRIFASTPLLNQAFIECIPDDRIFAVQDPMEDNLVVQVYNEVKAMRPMPYFGTPSL
jgi:hypothetical protein